MTNHARRPPRFPPAFASAWGDDAFGLWAELEVVPASGTAVVQRLRWIEPGVFLMGSPATELQRFKNEGPQHTVRLSQGFWLADTACTQALWQAVMGANPSHFTGDDQRPVERISWDDVQAFLSKLEALDPDYRMTLPSEAQWEYACRAGTRTPFSVGETIMPREVNYDGNYPYAGGVKGEYREHTVAVKSLPANAWGLYEMHGNVWEWCADGVREYTEDAVTDPVGPLGDGPAPRAVRGGSWGSAAGNARSACRFRGGSGDRNDFLSFRLCSRSQSQ